MKKSRHIPFVVGLAVALIIASSIPVAALQSPLEPGDEMGWVLYTDIVAYINGVPIQSYNIDGYTYVVAEDLANYGFKVSWTPEVANGLLSISSGSGIVTANYTPAPNTHQPGTQAMPYLYTEIITYMAGEPVWGANINGSTCVSMDDLAYFYGERCVYDNNTRTLHLTLRENCAAVVPGDYKFTYEAEDYSLDNLVYGDYAMWSFTKRSDGSFALTDSAGATKAVWQIELADDRVAYRIHFPQKTLTLTGSQFFVSSPHVLGPHAYIKQSLSTNRLYGFDGFQPDPTYYRAYCLQCPDIADRIFTLATEATEQLRVYVNGEAINGVPLTVPSYYYNAPGGREQTYEEISYLFDRRIPLDQVQTVRIEIGTPTAAPIDPAGLPLLPGEYPFTNYSITYTPDGDKLAFTAIMKPFADAGYDLGRLLTAPAGYSDMFTQSAYGYYYKTVGHVEITDGQIELVAEKGYSLYEWLFSDDCAPELIALREKHNCTDIESLVRAGVAEGLVTDAQMNIWQSYHAEWRFNKANLLRGDGQ